MDDYLRTKVSQDLKRHVGAFALVVDAKNEKGVGFYQHHGFIRFDGRLSLFCRSIHFAPPSVWADALRSAHVRFEVCQREQ